MPYMLRRACLMLSGCTLILLASVGHAQLWDALGGKSKPHMGKPKVSVLCLPPGATRPVPCNSATAETRLAFHLEQESPTNRVTLRLVPKNIRAQPILVPLRRGKQKLWTASNFKFSSQLCSEGKSIQFEIQVMTSDLNQSESPAGGDAGSIGYFQMQCGG